MCPDADLAPAPGNTDRLSAAAACLINQERVRHGLVALVSSPRLLAAAQHHTDDMVGRDYFAHVSPTGESPVQRVEATGYVPDGAGYVLGENLAWGTLSLSTPRAIVQAWIASPEHLSNILEPRYRETGMAVDATVPAAFSEGQPGAIYTQEFGVIDEG